MQRRKMGQIEVWWVQRISESWKAQGLGTMISMCKRGGRVDCHEARSVSRYYICCLRSTRKLTKSNSTGTRIEKHGVYSPGVIEILLTRYERVWEESHCMFSSSLPYAAVAAFSKPLKTASAWMISIMAASRRHSKKEVHSYKKSLLPVLSTVILVVISKPS